MIKQRNCSTHGPVSRSSVQFRMQSIKRNCRETEALWSAKTSLWSTNAVETSHTARRMMRLISISKNFKWTHGQFTIKLISITMICSQVTRSWTFLEARYWAPPWRPASSASNRCRLYDTISKWRMISSTLAKKRLEASFFSSVIIITDRVFTSTTRKYSAYQKCGSQPKNWCTSGKCLTSLLFLELWAELPV